MSVADFDGFLAYLIVEDEERDRPTHGRGRKPRRRRVE